MPWDFTIDPALVSWAERFGKGDLMSSAVNAGLAAMYPAVIKSVPVESGETLKAIATIDFASGMNASGGIGDMEKVGDPDATAPKNTLSGKKGSGGFIEWYRNNYGK
jgi:hypothetical protein